MQLASAAEALVLLFHNEYIYDFLILQSDRNESDHVLSRVAYGKAAALHGNLSRLALSNITILNKTFL